MGFIQACGGRFNGPPGVGGSAGDGTPPSTPGTPVATVQSSAQINWSWTPSTDNVAVIRYRLQRRIGTSGSFTDYATPATASYNDVGLTAGTTYQMQVRAEDAAGNVSSYSSVGSGVTSSGADTTAPTVPGTPNVVPLGSTSMAVNWTASTDAVGVVRYRVQRRIGVSGAFTDFATPVTNGFTDTGLTAGFTYQYQVRAEDAANNFSAYSPIGSGTTVASSTMKKGSNPDRGAYYKGLHFFINIIRDSDDSRWYENFGSAYASINTQGWPTSVPTGTILYCHCRWNNAAGYVKPGPYKIVMPSGWTATVRDTLNVTGIVAGNPATFTVGSPGVETRFYIQVQNNTGSTQTLSAASGMACYHTSHEALYNAGEDFHPDLLTALAGTASIRNSDPFGNNNGEYPFRNQADIPTLSNWRTRFWPPELFARLAKKLNCGIWWNQPTFFDRWGFSSSSATNRITLSDWGMTAAEACVVPVLVPAENEDIFFWSYNFVEPVTGGDSGPYKAINVNAGARTFQIAHPSAPTTSLTLNDSGSGNCTRMHDYETMWDYCIQKIHEEYPLCPALRTTWGLENWNGGYFGHHYARRPGAYIWNGSRTDQFYGWAHAYLSLKAWASGEAYFPHGVHIRVYEGQISPAGGAESLKLVDTGGIISAGQKVAMILDEVAVNPYIQICEDWSVANPEPGYIERDEMIARGYVGWSDAQVEHAALQFLPQLDFLLPFWQGEMAAQGRSGGWHFSAYEAGNHMRRDRPSAGTAGDIDQLMQIRTKNFFFTASSATMWDGFFAKLNSYGFTLFGQYVPAGQWYENPGGTQLQNFGLEPWYGASATNGYGYAYYRWSLLPS